MYHFELRPNRRLPLERELDKFFDVFNKEDYFAPACEILDEERLFSLSLDIPGVSREDIDIEVKDNHLYVTGERKSKAGRENVLRGERRYGKFSRVFSLPQNVSTNAIEANFENGVLDIIIPKEEKSLSKKISIGGANKTDAGAALKS